MESAVLVVTHAVGESMAVNVAFALFCTSTNRVPVVPAKIARATISTGIISGACDHTLDRDIPAHGWANILGLLEPIARRCVRTCP